MTFQCITKIKKTNKRRRCFWCSEYIESGGSCVKWAGTNCDEDFNVVHYHHECYDVIDNMTYLDMEVLGIEEGWEQGLFKRATKELRHP